MYGVGDYIVLTCDHPDGNRNLHEGEIGRIVDIYKSSQYIFKVDFFKNVDGEGDNKSEWCLIEDEFFVIQQCVDDGNEEYSIDLEEFYE